MKDKSKLIEVDLIVDPRPLTKEEHQMISDFIQADKAKRLKRVRRSAEKPLTTIKRLKKSPDRLVTEPDLASWFPSSPTLVFTALNRSKLL